LRTRPLTLSNSATYFARMSKTVNKNIALYYKVLMQFEASCDDVTVAHSDLCRVFAMQFFSFASPSIIGRSQRPRLVVPGHFPASSADERRPFIHCPGTGVKGRVTEVPVEANTLLKEGEVLFRVDGKPYECWIDKRRSLPWRCGADGTAS